MNKRGNGEGSIYKQRDNLWAGAVTIGRNDNGKAKRQTIYGKTRKEVADKIAKLQNDMLSGTFVEPNRLTVGGWVDAWLRDYKRNSLKPATYASYETNLRVHIKPHIGHILLKKLTTHDVQRMESIIFDGGKTSTSLIIKIHNVLHGALDQAVKNQLVSRNVSDGVELPAHKTKQIRILSMDEQKAFVAALEDEPSRAAFLTLLYTGLRVGELLALTWDDIDLSSGIIRVTKNLVTYMNHGEDRGTRKTAMLVQDSPKTKSGKRTVPLPVFLRGILAEHKLEQCQQAILLEGIYNDQNIVFPTATGNYCYTRNLQEKLTRITKNAGLEKLTIHALRHSYATRLFEQGVPAKTVADLLGHANPVVTQMVYIHVMPEVKFDAVQKLEAVNEMMGCTATHTATPLRLVGTG